MSLRKRNLRESESRSESEDAISLEYQTSLSPLQNPLPLLYLVPPTMPDTSPQVSTLSSSVISVMPPAFASTSTGAALGNPIEGNAADTYIPHTGIIEEEKHSQPTKEPSCKSFMHVDPNADNCILTGDAGLKIAMQYAHLLPWTTTPEDLTVLEYKWGMPRESLCIETRFNVFSVMSDWYILYNRSHWAFIPDYPIVRQLLTWVEQGRDRAGPISEFCRDEYRIAQAGSQSQPRASTPQTASDANLKLAPPIYSYYMLPLDNKLEHTLLFRRLPGETGAIQHRYPFTSLGPLRSHIQPHFVVYALGAKLKEKREKFGGENFDLWLDEAAQAFGSNPSESKQCLLNVLEIFAKWAPGSKMPPAGDPWYETKGRR